MKYKAVLVDVWSGIELYSEICDDIMTAKVYLQEENRCWSCDGFTCQGYIEMLLFDEEVDL